MNASEEMKIRLSECPLWIVEKSVSYLKSVFTESIIEDIVRYHKSNPDSWWAEHHFDWGMRIRNLLRDNVCLDNILPSGNWDDYYVQMIELACELRSL